MLRFDASEKIAITEENGLIILWSVTGSGKPRTFTNKNGDKAILNSDNGAWWQGNRKEADNCFFAQLWAGDFPWDSWCWAIRVCKSTGEAKVNTITTDINPSGLSTAERWERDCLAFSPIVSA